MRDADEPWERKHDLPAEKPFIPHLRQAYPRTIDEVVAMITEAAEKDLPIRVAGSGWSLSEAVVPAGYHGILLRTEELNGTINDVLPKVLTNEAVECVVRGRAGEDTSGPDGRPWSLYHVGAGIKLYDLYSRLDGQEPAWPLLDPITSAEDHAGPWALHTMGNAGGQSLLGAVSTSTHGADGDLPPLADAVVAMHLVDSSGRRLWVEPKDWSGSSTIALTDPSRVAAVLPGTTHVRSDGLFNALLVSVGRLGIVCSAVIRVTKQFALVERTEERVWEGEVRQWLSHDRQTTRCKELNHRAVQIVISPHRSHDGLHRAYLTTRDLADDADRHLDDLPGRAGRAGVNAGGAPPIGIGCLQQWVCSRASARDILNPLRALRERSDGLEHLPKHFREVDSLDAQRLATAAEDAARGSTLGEVMTHLVNRVMAEEILPLHLRTGAVALINNVLFKSALPEGERTDISYALMDQLDYTDKNCKSSADSIEVAFDATEQIVVDWLERVFVRIDELHRGDLVLAGTAQRHPAAAFAGYISLRFTSRSRANLAIQRWPRTVIVEVAGLKGLSGIDALLDAIERDAIDMGATVHWGQRNIATASDVEASFGAALDEWRSALSELEPAGGSRFATSFTDARGLRP
jgi:hypothetical protein